MFPPEECSKPYDVEEPVTILNQFCSLFYNKITITAIEQINGLAGGYSQLDIKGRRSSVANLRFTMKKSHSFSEKSYRKETIFQIMYIVYPVLALVGVLGNLLTIVILSRGNCGLSKCITYYLVAMAAADLVVVVADVILTRMNFLFYPVCFLDLTYICAVGTSVQCVAADCSAWLTIAFTFDRFVAICYPRANATYSSKRTAAVVIGAIWAVSCATNMPWYLAIEPLLVIGNMSWFCKAKESFYTSLGWAMFNWIDIILTPFIPFFLILALNTLTVSTLWPLTKFAEFHAVWSAYVVYIIYGQTVNYYYTDYNHPIYILYHTAIMLQLSNSATNTCVYAVTQTKFREEVKKAVKYPFVLMMKQFSQTGLFAKAPHVRIGLIKHLVLSKPGTQHCNFDLENTTMTLKS
ncbi:probable G-protein coupled receptor 139 [Callorhinchus milii]|uniref:probable G-protein coupled receptor 139 n=1 Tax=Callorhinchus milii TaxID=7868 RepID=UPI001C3FCEFF|nr:probable G-protein coupled receptor 139 [Callorhinchus milii]